MTDQAYDDINTATAGKPVPVQTATFARAPPVTVSLYDEINPMLLFSRFAYDFTNLLEMCKDGSLTLDVPEGCCFTNLGRFLDENIDMTEFNGGNGMSFYDLSMIMEHNQDAIRKAFAGSDFNLEVMDRLLNSHMHHDGTDSRKNHFLVFHRYIRQGNTCVYSIIKDALNKTVTVSFRGSTGTPFSTRDWQTNLNAFATDLRTPKKIKDKMQGILQKRVLVHKGFNDYLFNNDRIDGQQRYDDIIDDIVVAIDGKEGYSVSITGHSLGGALATLFSFKLAGAGKKRDVIPRPITCITFAAPFSGTAGYRTATEHMERDGLLRSIRVTNADDIVPALPFISFIGRRRFMKQVGINVRVSRWGCRVEHSSRANFWTALRNTFFKPIWLLMRWHGLEKHDERIEQYAEQLKGMTVDDIYTNEKYVSKNFIDGKAL